MGVGAGNPEMMTLEAVRILEACPIIATVTTKSGQCLAFDIAKQASSLNEKSLLPIEFTMSKVEAERIKSHHAAADKIIDKLSQGLDVAMPNLGDVSIYSTSTYLLEIIRDAGFNVKMIAGVPSFCAIAASLGIGLTKMDSPLHIIPACHDGWEQTLDCSGSKVLMKAGQNPEKIVTALKQRGLAEKAVAIESCGLESERIIRNIEDLRDGTGYFTTIIIKE